MEMYFKKYHFGKTDNYKKCFVVLNMHSICVFLKLQAMQVIITSFAFKMTGFILRPDKIFEGLSTSLDLYKMLVCTQLEYCGIWNACYQIHINRIETIQKVLK